MVGGARAQLCALTSRSSESPNPFRSLDEDDGKGLTYAGTELLAHGDDVTTTEIRGIRAQRKMVRFKGADSLPQESRASRRADDSFEEWEKELRGNENRSTARSAFPVATTEALRRSRPGVGRMAKLAPQRARKLESAQPQEPMDSIEVARGVAVKFELGASLTTDIAVCPVGGTVPTIPVVGNNLLTDIPDPPVSSHGPRQRGRRRTIQRWAESHGCATDCGCPSGSGSDEELTTPTTQTIGSVVVLPHADEAGKAETQAEPDEDLLHPSQPGVVTLAGLFGPGINAIGKDGTQFASGLHLLTERPKSALNALSYLGEGDLDGRLRSQRHRYAPVDVSLGPDRLGPRTGTEYEVANGEEVVSLGEKHCLLKFSEKEVQDGETMGMTFQVVDVSKALLSVSRVMEQGHDVIFTLRGEGSAILVEGKAEQRILLRHSGGSFELDVWVKPEAGFARPR